MLPLPSDSAPDWRATLRARWVGLPLSPADLESVIEELAQHLESEERELRSRGVSATEARIRLANQLDDAELLATVRRRAPVHPASPLAVDPRRGLPGVPDWIGDAWRDLRFGVRSLSRERSFTGFVVTALALGIGANAAMFGILDRLLLRGPLHVRDAHQLRRVVSTMQPPGRPVQRTGYLGYAQYETFRADTQNFAGVAAYNFLLNGLVLGEGEGARAVNSGTATAGFFPLLGVRPALGRFFDEREDDPNDPRNVVVLGYGLWQTEFGGRPDVLGSTIRLDYSPYTVIGVAPEGFSGVDLMRVDVWRPESGAAHSTNWRRTWSAPWIHIVVRLRPEVPPAQASAALTRLHRNAYPGRDSVIAKASLAAEPVHYTYAGAEATETRVSRWLLGVAVIVLLITCANVGNLLLARTMKRRRELAVRLTLGAGRLRVIRLLVLEALLLTVAGATAGLFVAYGFGAAARALIEHVDWIGGAVDARVLLATAGLCVFACLLVGLVPAVQGSTTHLGQSLRNGVREGGGRTAWFRTALTVFQAALSVVLLVGAGLFVQSLRHVRQADLGIETDRFLSFQLERMGAGFYFRDTVAQRLEVGRREALLPMIAEQLRSWPDIERVSIAAGLPFDRNYEYPIRMPGIDSLPLLPGGGPFVASVWTDYFATVGTPILRGRAFTIRDRTGSVPVAVINETTARTLWRGDNPIGKCIIVAEATRCAEIVGVVADTKRSSFRDEEAMQIYVPRDQQPTGGHPRLLVRPRGDLAVVRDAVRKELLRADPTIWNVQAEVLHQKVDDQIRPWRLGATIFTLFGLLALLVACIGLYSVISYFVTQRTQEIGVRIALGARPVDVSRLVLQNGLVLAGSGVAIGLMLAVGGAHALAPLLFDTSPRDPLVLGVVAFAMTIVALPAALIPALRARRIDPMDAIRMD
jgi:predicted permease